MPELATAPFSERAPSPEALTDLEAAAFANYSGVIEPSLAFTRWFMARPGFDRELSRGAWHDDLLVASIFAVRAALLITRRPWQLAIVDTVMTHPSYRRQGVARALLSEAEALGRRAGLAALQLYTQPGSAGYRLYGSLGFLHLRTLRYWHRTAKADGNSPLKWAPARPDDRERVMAVLTALARTHEGVPVQTESLWRWRKCNRPRFIAPTVWVRGGSSEIRETLTSAPVRLTGEQERLLLSDAVIESPASLADFVRGLPDGPPQVALADEIDDRLQEALGNAGFVRGQEEAVMLLPLGEPSLAGLLRGSRRPWFPLTESIVGV